MKIIVAGDIHGCWDALETLLDEEKPDVILQCGDIGFWPKFSPFPSKVLQKKLRKSGTTIHFCEGNHEDLDTLMSMENPEVAPNIFYRKRGSLINVGNRNILFMGGALSVDKAWRMPHVSWFPQETIRECDLYGLPPLGTKIDIVISHTAPTAFPVVSTMNLPTNIGDPSRNHLSYILEEYRPTQWYFGHWHYYMQGYDAGCYWMGLNQAPLDQWYVRI